MRAEEIAQVCHEANRAYCISLGDTTQLHWDDALKWQQDSAIMGVRALIIDPSMSPEDLHAAWCKQKIHEGWNYGVVKDSEKRTHPQLVPYSELSDEQQRKDYLFQAIVRVLVPLPGGFVHI